MKTNISKLWKSEDWLAVCFCVELVNFSPVRGCI